MREYINSSDRVKQQQQEQKEFYENLPPGVRRGIANTERFVSEHSARVDPRMQKAALGAVLGSAGITAGGALVDQFVGEDNALNSGEPLLNAPIALMPAAGAGFGAVVGNRMVSPQYREGLVEAAKPGRKELLEYSNEHGADAASQYFAQKKNAAIDQGIGLRNRRAYQGMAGGAIGGAALGLMMMQDRGGQQVSPPGDQQSIAASLNMKDLNELNALLDANRAY